MLLTVDFSSHFETTKLTMLKVIVLISLFCVISITAFVGPIRDYTQDALYPCVQCLCHARTGCWRRRNCASYSINQDYWNRAGSLVVSPDDAQLSDRGYSKCMWDENCIVGTIIEYTKSWGQMDCNCDGIVDCKDLAAIHLFGKKCERPMYGYLYASRFNSCAARIGVKEMLTQEGDDQCTVPDAQ